MMCAENLIQSICTVITVPMHELLVRTVSGGALIVQDWRLQGSTQLNELGTNSVPSILPTGEPRTIINGRSFQA